ncbi:hypothetical protein QE152_g5136 [Popillia japonica]|uniref:Uncharacterized protein n=1 Tax=Popillia japonica TaxID=7064 RepID=A0AAW1MY84_POPJA
MFASIWEKNLHHIVGAKPIQEGMESFCDVAGGSPSPPIQAYPKRLGKDTEDDWIYCGVQDTIFVCGKWQDLREEVRVTVGLLTPETLAHKMNGIFGDLEQNSCNGVVVDA